jgi:hypothetical protein
MVTLTRPPKLTKADIGTAGEAHVMAALAQRGYVVASTRRNAARIDLLASTPDGRRLVAIQVKTVQHGKPKWPLRDTIERCDDHVVFVFVRLHHGAARPSFHVVPRREVARYCREDNAAWLATPGRRGRPHKANEMRNFRDPDGRCLDNWGALGLEEPEQPQ